VVSKMEIAQNQGRWCTYAKGKSCRQKEMFEKPHTPTFVVGIIQEIVLLILLQKYKDDVAPLFLSP
jgi:hypothetical protein